MLVLQLSCPLFTNFSDLKVVSQFIKFASGGRVETLITIY